MPKTVEVRYSLLISPFEHLHIGYCIPGFLGVFYCSPVSISFVPGSNAFQVYSPLGP